jgi:hypothetical protein
LQFRFRLALALGKSLAEVDALSLWELRHWSAFFRIYPPPAERSDIQAAIVAQACAAPWGGPSELKPFIIDYAKGAVEESPLQAARRREQELVNAVRQCNQHPGHG